MSETEIDTGTFWWVDVNSDQSIETNNPLQSIIDHRITFNITKDDQDFLKENFNNPDAALSFYDKVCSQGWMLIQSPPNSPGLTICFWIEDYAVYDRIARWLRARGLKKGMLLLRELSSMRGWEQPVESLLAMKQYSKDPSTHVSCQYCGTQISHEELIMKRVCPRCGQALA